MPRSSPGRGSRGRSSGAGWRSAIWTATAGPTSSSTPSMPPPPCCGTSPEGNHFLALDIVDKTGRPAVGARVQVRAGGHRQAGVVTAGGSYLASAPSRLVVRAGRCTIGGTNRRDVAVGRFGSRGLAPTVPGRGALRIEQGSGRGQR